MATLPDEFLWRENGEHVGQCNNGTCDGFIEFSETAPESESFIGVCPECGVEVYEESEQCPVCGCYITHHHSVWHGKPTWWILLGALGIAAAVLMFLSL